MRSIDIVAKRRFGAPYWQNGGVTNLPPIAGADSASTAFATSVDIDVLANDSDPEMGALSVTAASAIDGTVAILPDDQLRYTPASGFSGVDTITYTVTDPGARSSMGTVTVTVADPILSISDNGHGTVTVDAEDGEIDVTITSPAEFVGTYVFDTALLETGPVNLVPPAIQGTAEVGQTLTIRDGLWVYEGALTGESVAWRRDGTPISGETSASYAVQVVDAGQDITVLETITQTSGSRAEASPIVTIASTFQPGDDTNLISWFDATDAGSITDTGGTVSGWSARSGGGSLTSAGVITIGSRTLNSLNVLDFNGSGGLSGLSSLPANGDVAFHGVFEIDGVISAFAAILAVNATNDFQLDADDNSSFLGRLNVTGSGSAVSLTGGPYSGAALISVIFDLTGAGTYETWINGVLVGSGAYTAALDTSQTLRVMANRTPNAYVDGSVGELCISADTGNRADYHAYLNSKWGLGL